MNSNHEKFKNLVLYILSHRDYTEQGIKKLNKILYFIDFYFYRDHEKFISEGIEYAKADMGPVVNEYKLIFDTLVQKHILEKVDEIGKIIFKPVSLPDISQFTSEEVAHIDRVLHRYGELSASELESISHEQQPWILTEHMGDIIDPDLALLMATDDESDEKIAYSKDLQAELIELANTV